MTQQHSVVLRATVEIHGRTVQVATTADPEFWHKIPEYQDSMKAQTLRVLAEAIVKQLAPEVVVELPEPSLRESLADALRPYDYPQEY